MLFVLCFANRQHAAVRDGYIKPGHARARQPRRRRESQGKRERACPAVFMELPGSDGLRGRLRSSRTRLVLVHQAPRHRRVGRIRDLSPDVRAGGGQLDTGRSGRRRPPEHQPRRSASDPTPQAPASANDDSGPARQVTHNRRLPLRVHGFTGCRTRRGGGTRRRRARLPQRKERS